MSALTDAIGCLAASLQTLAGETGLYSRDPTGLPNVQITGTPVINEYDVIDDETMLPTKVLSYDWIFSAADLVLPGIVGLITPRPGDRWKPTINGQQETYEVMPLSKRPCYERHDTSGVLLLVHTKKVAA
jgi:hypothetical protein